MPTYIYFCEKCDCEFECVQGMNDLSVADCPDCLCISKHRIPQLFSAIDRTPKTLGALADANRKNMSQSQYEETVQNMANERKQLIEYKGCIPEGAQLAKKPTNTTKWFRPDSPVPDTKLLNANNDQIRRYVETGKRPIGT